MWNACISFWLFMQRKTSISKINCQFSKINNRNLVNERLFYFSLVRSEYCKYYMVHMYVLIRYVGFFSKSDLIIKETILINDKFKLLACRFYLVWSSDVNLWSKHKLNGGSSSKVLHHLPCFPGCLWYLLVRTLFVPWTCVCSFHLDHNRTAVT